MNRTKFVRQSPGHYRRADGVTIRRPAAGVWVVYLPNGDRACWVAPETGEVYGFGAAAPTLADAKVIARGVTPTTPAYVSGGQG